MIDPGRIMFSTSRNGDSRMYDCGVCLVLRAKDDSPEDIGVSECQNTLMAGEFQSSAAGC